MSIKKFLPLFLLLVSVKVSAQKSEKDSFSETMLKKQITGRFNFLGLLDPFDQNISIGGEYKFRSHWSAGMDVAYVFHSNYFPESKFARGYNVSPFIRYYPLKHRYDFFEAALRYKHVSYRLKDWIGKDIVNGIPSYEEYTAFYYLKNFYEFNLKMGTALNLSRDKKLRSEFYIGLGVRYKKQGSHIGFYSPERRGYLPLYEPEYTTVSIPMGVRIIYQIP